MSGDGVADKIEVDANKNVVSNVAISGNDVIIEVSSRAGTATERAVIQGAVGIQFGSNVVAQVNATDLVYDGTANFSKFLLPLLRMARRYQLQRQRLAHSRRRG